jgi:aspartate racemase
MTCVWDLASAGEPDPTEQLTRGETAMSSDLKDAASESLNEQNRSEEILGIIGGLGPLASAEFLKTIYEHGVVKREQDFPKVLMYSDPTYPARTQAFLSGRYEAILEKLIEEMHCLCNLGATKLVICCLTIHYLVPMLPKELLRKLVSLIDIIMAEVSTMRKKRLVICSTGTSKLKLFQDHQLWETCKDYLIFPNEKDQNVINCDLIDRIKLDTASVELVPLLKFMLTKYHVDSFIVACTEIHVLAKSPELAEHNKKYGCIDPLTLIARRVAEGRL